MSMFHSLKNKKLREKVKKVSSLYGLDAIIYYPLSTIVGGISNSKIYLDKIIEPFFKLVDDLCINIIKRLRKVDDRRANSLIYLFQDMRMKLLNYKMIPYFDFGKDNKYLKEVKIEFVDDIDDLGLYEPEERKIYININYSWDKSLIAHEQSHAIVDIKYGLWEKIGVYFNRMYEDTYEEICKDTIHKVHMIIKEKVNEAKKKLYELKKEENDSSFEKECLLYAHACRDLVRVLNKCSVDIAKRFEEMYGKEVGEFVRLCQEIEGLNELLARAVQEHVLCIDVVHYDGIYFFKGSITVYMIWKMLNEIDILRLQICYFMKELKELQN